MKNSFVTFLVVLVALLVVLTVVVLLDRDEEIDENGELNGEQEILNEVVLEDEVLGEDVTPPSAEFIQCLADSGMVIYGSKTCPFCVDLVEDFGGYEAVEALYVECTDEGERCSEEMQTMGVPEIQYNGELFEGARSMENFAELTGCEL